MNFYENDIIIKTMIKSNSNNNNNNHEFNESIDSISRKDGLLKITNRFLNRVKKAIDRCKTKSRRCENVVEEEKNLIKSLIVEIDQLKSSNSSLWLQIQEILSSDFFRLQQSQQSSHEIEAEKTNNDESGANIEHFYEAISSSQTILNKIEKLLDDELNQTPEPLESAVNEPQKESPPNKVAEKIEKFNRLALKKQAENYAKKRIDKQNSAVVKKRSSNIVKRHYEEKSTNVSFHSVNSLLAKNNSPSNRQYESILKIKNTIKMFQK